MARFILSRNFLFRFNQEYNSSQRLSSNISICTNDSKPHVIHDRQNQRFTITLDCDGGTSTAVLKYNFRHENHVELLSTTVPQSYRGKGVAAHLAQAALDFIVEEKFKASISCWYIRKYVDENPHLQYKTYIEN